MLSEPEEFLNRHIKFYNKNGRVKKTKVFSYVLLFIDITVVIFHKKVYNAPYPIRMILRNPMQQLQPFSVCYDIYKDCVQ